MGASSSDWASTLSGQRETRAASRGLLSSAISRHMGALKPLRQSTQAGRARTCSTPEAPSFTECSSHAAGPTVISAAYRSVSNYQTGSNKWSLILLTLNSNTVKVTGLEMETLSHKFTKHKEKNPSLTHTAFSLKWRHESGKVTLEQAITFPE